VTEAPEPDGVTAQVGAWEGAGCTAQPNKTVLLNPPLGLTVTVPVAHWPAATVPGESVDPVKEKSAGTLKVAVTDLSASMTKSQEPVLEQAPLQPAKVDPENGTSRTVTRVPRINPAVQLCPQRWKPGEIFTPPVPVPFKVTKRVKLGMKVLFIKVNTL